MLSNVVCGRNPEVRPNNSFGTFYLFILEDGKFGKFSSFK